MLALVAAALVPVDLDGRVAMFERDDGFHYRSVFSRSKIPLRSLRLARRPKIGCLIFALRPSSDLSARFHNVGSSGFSISSPSNCCLSFFAILFLPFLSDRS